MIFEIKSRDILCISCWIVRKLNATRPHWWLVSIGSGNGLVPSGNKPLPEPILDKIYVTIWRHRATMSQSLMWSIDLTAGKRVCMACLPDSLIRPYGTDVALKFLTFYVKHHFNYFHILYYPSFIDTERAQVINLPPGIKDMNSFILLSSIPLSLFFNVLYIVWCVLSLSCI